jgi:hypothetical protein
MRVTPKLLAPQPPDDEFCKPFSVDLRLSDYVYKRWHHVTLTTKHVGTNTNVEVDFKPYHDDAGRYGGSHNSFPARGGARHSIAFDVPAGSKLYLRNVVMSGASSAVAQR